MAYEIFWPEGYLPGTVDNYVSNEIIVSNLRAKDVWPYLVRPLEWFKYYIPRGTNASGNC